MTLCWDSCAAFSSNGSGCSGGPSGEGALSPFTLRRMTNQSAAFGLKHEHSCDCECHKPFLIKQFPSLTRLKLSTAVVTLSALRVFVRMISFFKFLFEPTVSRSMGRI